MIKMIHYLYVIFPVSDIKFISFSQKHRPKWVSSLDNINSYKNKRIILIIFLISSKSGT